MTKELSGVLAALCTPFDGSGENVDEPTMFAHIDTMIDAGIHGIVLCAGTGEFAYLRDGEKKHIIEVCTRHIGGRVPVIVQTSAINTVETIERSKHAESVGVDALMILPPYFEGPGESGVLHHFERISSAVDTPIVIYNIPQHSGFDVTADLFARMLEFDNIEYIKDSKGDLIGLQELVATGGKVLSGADPLAPYALMAGSVGWIWGAANVMPRETVDLYDLISSGRHADGLALWAKMAPANLHFWAGIYNLEIKTAAGLRGYNLGPLREPGMPPTDDEVAALKRVLAPLDA
ncbi:MAG: dihydrodipicolinate synthase family protein [Rhodospirillales bacterium]|nr:dihydrodipicolinate synthase family protein [Rhodospirillales bacterium]